MTVAKNFIKAVNLINDKDHSELIGRDLVDRVSFEIVRLHELKSLITSQKEQVPSSELLKEISCELIRLKELNIPLEVQHVTNPMTDNEPREYDTNFKKVINAHDAVTETLWSLEEQCARFEINMVSGDVSTIEKLVLIKNFIDTSELNSHAMFSLGLAVGLHNQEMYSAYFTNKGIESEQNKQVKTGDSYHQKFGIALKLLRDIMHDFYKHASHHPYKPNLVIDQVQNLCILYLIPFPMDRKRPEFKSILKVIMFEIPKHSSWKGASKKIYSKLNESNFANKYDYFFERLTKK